MPLTSLTFTFAQRAGFPVYQTWFSALEYDVTGTVTAPAGQQAGITVLLFDPEGNQVGETTTNADGEYAFPGFATYDGYRVQVVRPTGLTSDDPLTQTVDLSDGDQIADFSLRAIVPVPVSGTVRDPEGNPVAGVTITLTTPGGGTARTAVTESDGTCVFDDVPVGAGYTLTATPPGDSTVDGPLTFTVPPDTEDPIVDQDFVTPAPTGTVSGIVTEEDEGGPGRAGVRIDVVGPDGARYSVVTNEDGAWSLPDLPPGDYTATVRPPFGTAVDGAASRDFTIPPTGGTVADQDFVIDVLPTGAVSGQVTEGDAGGAGRQGVSVNVIGPEGARYSAITNADGAWSLTGLPPGDYTATVVPLDGTGVVGAGSRNFTIPPTGGDVDDQDFVLAPIHSASGTVTDDDDQPVPGVDVLVTDTATGASQTVTTGDDGTWTADGLVPGAYTATVTVPDGYEPVGDTTLSFTVDDDDVDGLDFELAPQESAPSPSPSTTTSTGAPSPVPTVTETAVEVVSGGGGSGSGSSGSGSGGSLASTGGPSLLIGLGGVALLLAGLLTLAGRRRGRRS